MIYLVMTPFAIGMGVYLVPRQIGAPGIALPRLTLLGYWLYVLGALTLLAGFAIPTGAAADGWFSYPPMADSEHSPGAGTDLWIVGVFLAVTGTILMGWAVLWTVLRRRTHGMTMLRLPVFCWAMIATCLVMFFPYLAAVAEVLAVFSGRRFFGYRGTALSLLVFAALSMSVWGHHMFATGQAANDYYSLTSMALLVPAGVEYFGMLGTLVGGRLRLRTPMLFALAFVPQFLIGGLTGIMVGTPVIDYHVTDSYFVVAHLHYVLFAGSAFGLFAAVYFWFPKVTGTALDEGMSRLHFWLLVIGTNLTFLPMFALGYLGMPRRVATYAVFDGFGLLNLLATIGAAFLAAGMTVFAVNVLWTLRRRSLGRAEPAGADPWDAHTLEWATTSPPPRLNFPADRPPPPVSSFAPLLDLRRRERSAP
ncbi:cbb3-type cytochrome c oxidase subunit I [Streptomyces sp. NPDC050743]|uniref:cytochrome c oxidase subunit I n=1 Tax=Streptomyces sp. NPDC050743 TaxID=3365634 RepID=UPI0037B56312